MLPRSLNDLSLAFQENCDEILLSSSPDSPSQGTTSKDLSERKVHVTGPLLPLSQATHQEDGKVYQLVLDNDGRGYCQVQEEDRIDHVPFSKLTSITSGFDPVEFQQRREKGSGYSNLLTFNMACYEDKRACFSKLS